MIKTEICGTMHYAVFTDIACSNLENSTRRVWKFADCEKNIYKLREILSYLKVKIWQVMLMFHVILYNVIKSFAPTHAS